jgi:hypothetical protein
LGKRYKVGHCEPIDERCKVTPLQLAHQESADSEHDAPTGQRAAVAGTRHHVNGFCTIPYVRADLEGDSIEAQVARYASVVG